MAVGWVIGGSVLAGLLAKRLLRQDGDQPIIDEKPPTMSTVGTFIPVLVGTRRISPFIAWVGNRVKQEEKSAGGKGINTGGSSDQIVYYEDAIHVLTVGPAYKIHAIKINGKNAKFNDSEPIDSQQHPSGSSFTTKDGDEFEVYWGDSYATEPINTWAGDPSRLGISTKWPWTTIIIWKKKRLGGFPTWQAIEYDTEVRPYSNLLDTSGWPALNWMSNGPGPNGTPHNLLGVQNSTLVGDLVNGPYFKVWNNGSDATGFYPENGFCAVTGQSNSNTNKVYLINSSAFDDFETYTQVPDGGWYTAPDGVLDEDMTLWTTDSGVSVNKLVNLPDTDYPQGFTTVSGAIYEIINTNATSNVEGIWDNAKDVGNDEDTFRAGAQRFRIWIKGINAATATADRVDVAFTEVGTGQTPYMGIIITRDASGDIFYTANDPDAVEVTMTPAGNDWHYIEFTHKTEKFTWDSGPAGDRIQIFAKCGNIANTAASQLRIFHNGGASNNTNMLRYNEGVTRTGITTIYLNEPLSGAQDDQGQVEGYVNGTGADGPNPAHTLGQLLFEDYPHGRGLSQDNWDMESLQELSTLVENEGLRLHLLADQGKTVEDAVVELLTDMHAYITWNPNKGKYVFGSIRSTTGELVTQIPQESLANVYPEHENILDPDKVNNVIFSFTDRDHGYRRRTRPIADDAAAFDGGNRLSTTVELKTPTDVFAARTVASRRRAEVIIPANSYSFKAKHETRNLVPGTPLRVESFPALGEEEVLRLIDVDVKTDSPEVSLRASTDVFTVDDDAAEEPISGPLGEDDGPGAPLPDSYGEVWELPPFLAGGKITLSMLRVASNTNSIVADIYASSDDVTYEYVGSNKAAVGGTLITDLSSYTLNTLENTSAPVILPVGARPVTDVPTLSDEEWRRGRTLAYINGELFHLRKLTSMGDGTYRMDGLVRARLGTTKQTHSAGDVVYIFKWDELTRFSDLNFASNRDAHLKAAPAGLLLSAAVRFWTPVEGKGIRPMSPLGLRTGNLSNHYKTGEDVTVKWMFYDPEAFEGRYGSGFQRAGERREEATEPLGFFRVTFMDGVTEMRSVETKKNTLTYLNSEIVADTGGPEVDITVEVRMVRNGYTSDPATILVEKL